MKNWIFRFNSDNCMVVFKSEDNFIFSLIA